MGTLKAGDHAVISDPFVIKEAGQWYMLLGAHMEGGKACISLYRSDNMIDWDFMGIPLVGEEPRHWEVATLFKLDNKWVVTYAPQGSCRYYTGTMDFEKCHFEPEYHGYLDYSGSFGFDHKIHGSGDYKGTVYAPYVGEVDNLGRRPFWMTTGGGLSLTRIFRVRPDGRLSQQPVTELSQLRSDHYQEWNVRLTDVSHVVDDVRGQGDTIEIIAEIDPGTAETYGLKIRRSPDGKSFAPITYDGRFLVVGDKKAEVDLMDGVDTLNLHVFIDGSLVEVFANDWVVFSNNIGAPATNMGVEAFAEGGEAHLKLLDIWQMKLIW